jgi:cobyrinic acid a,c-diamide synthase
MIAGTHSGAGKTTLSLGIMGVLSEKYKVQPFKVGPDYIDTAYHRYVTGSFSVNLDLYMLGEEKLKNLFYKNASCADISIIEGVMGLYDGIDATSRGSSAHIAKLVNVPVVLVVDASSMAASVSALIMGYIHYDKEVDVRGVILNKVGNERHYALLKEIIERDLDIEVFGYLPKDAEFELPERHLGLLPVYETENLDKKLKKLYECVKNCIDTDKLMNLTVKLPYFSGEGNKVVKEEKVKIAYAYDEAFNFYYKASLEALEEMGAHLIPFSPLKDEKLPEGIDGIYIGGGFPEVFAKRLSENKKMLKEIKEAAEKGMPVYAEGGGFMYLSKSIRDLEGNTYSMVGVFDFEVVMTKRLQRFGYVEAEVSTDNVLFKKGEKIKGHEFHYSRIEGFPQNASYTVNKPGKEEKWECGFVYKNTLASFVHIDLYAYKDGVKRFLDKCLSYRRK